MLTPNPMPITSVAPASLDLNVGVINPANPQMSTSTLSNTVPNDTNSGVLPTAESEQTQQYHIIVPPPLPYTASQKVL